MAKRITSKQVHCPRCGALPGRSCRSERIPSANSFGGGWGGPPTIKNSHKERIEEAKWKQAQQEAVITDATECTTPGCTSFAEGEHTQCYSCRNAS